MANENVKIEKIRKLAVSIFPKYGVRKAALFGSVARGTATAKSDIDMLVNFSRSDASLLDLSGLKIELEDRLKKMLT